MTVPQLGLRMQQVKSKLALLQRQRGKLRSRTSWWRFGMRTYWPPLASSLDVRVSPTKSDLRSKVANQQAFQAGQGLPVCWVTPQLLLLPVAQVRTPPHTLSPKRLVPPQLLQVQPMSRVPFLEHKARRRGDVYSWSI
ncbi:TPA: hypothetical protein ACH3X1_001178 [Trebouxia sp. C0004]